MEKLISMVDYVLDQEKEFDVRNYRVDEFSTRYTNIYKYAKFLKQPLTLGMFIPVGEDGNVLEAIQMMNGDKIGNQDYWNAKDRVLFKGFEVCERNDEMDCVVNGSFHLSTDFKYTKTIEDLSYNLELTPNAINQ